MPAAARSAIPRIHGVPTTLTLAELEQSGERELGTSDWHTIGQRQIDLFAEATGDRQWIHTNPERAAAGPFGTTVHRLRATPRLGFLAHMRRSSGPSWRATVEFPRAGDWQLIVPNWCAAGYATPLPAVRVVTVR